MIVSHKSIDKRLRAVEGNLERYRQNKKSRVTLIYRDGHTVECLETLSVRIDENEAYFEWCQYVDGYIDKPPDLSRVINHDTGEDWNLEESASHRMTKEEMDEFIKQVEEEVRKHEY